MSDTPALAPAPTPKAPRTTAFADPVLERAFQFCLLNAPIGDAFPEALTRTWFDACFTLCAEFVGLIWPPRKVKTQTSMDPRRGLIHLNPPPSGPVQFWKGPFLIATLPPDHPCLQGTSFQGA